MELAIIIIKMHNAPVTVYYDLIKFLAEITGKFLAKSLHNP